MARAYAIAVAVSGNTRYWTVGSRRKLLILLDVQHEVAKRECMLNMASWLG